MIKSAPAEGSAARSVRPVSSIFPGGPPRSAIIGESWAMPLYVMDCYVGGVRPADAVLRESVEIVAPSRAAAIDEAHRRAAGLKPRFFELRDPARRWDTVYYNSETGET